MKRQRLLLLLLALAGCSYDAHDQAHDDVTDAGDGDRLVGGWYARSDEPSCTTMLTFNAEGVYSFDHMCELGDGKVGEEVHEGDFVDMGAAVALTPHWSSCAAVDGREIVARYDLDGETLRVKLGARELVLSPSFERLDGAPAYGCFAGDGGFESGGVEKF